MFCGLQRGNLCWFNQVTLRDNNTLENVANPSKQVPAVMRTVDTCKIKCVNNLLTLSCCHLKSVFCEQAVRQCCNET